jgi:alpha-L-fucosidase
MASRSAVLAALGLLVAPFAASAQTTYEPTPGNLAAREWYREARFGLFVHWGVYSTLANGEWVMQTQRIPVQRYEELPSFFDPYRFDAREWVRLVKEAGMRYITITAKHHDGFAMYDSRASDWDIVDRTRSGRDVLAELAEACREEGIRLFFYYSQLDWHHPDYWPRGQTGHTTGRSESGDWNAYIDYMNAQLTELLTGYGPLGGIWFDGMWDRPDADWRLQETYELIHGLQPSALIISNHHQAPIPGEDVQTFEKDLPGHNTAGFNQTAVSESLPLEMSQTISGAWGYNIYDTNFKSTDDLVVGLVRAAGYDANHLLNIGPMPDGRIQPEFQERLRGIGAWLREFGESIYGTRGGPVPPGDWGVSTRTPDAVFLHVLQDDLRALGVEWPPGLETRSARSLRTGEAVAMTVEDGVLVVGLPERPAGVVDEIIVIDVSDD